MFKIFLIILTINNALGDDESYEKYIDLLPEAEKQEFLDRIARRILEGIQTDQLSDPNQPNIEITDDQLDANDAYVQDILKEETERLENERQDESLKVKGINVDGNVDLTLRNGEMSEKINGDQDLRMETTSEFPYYVIPVKTVYDDINDDPNETVNKELNENLSIRIKHEIKDSSNASKNNNESILDAVKDNIVPHSLNNTKNDNSLRKSFQSNASSIGISTDFEQSIDTNSFVTEDYFVDNETNIQTSNKNMFNMTSDKVIDAAGLSSSEKDLSKEVKPDRTTTVSNTATTTSATQTKQIYKDIDKEEYEARLFTVEGNKTSTEMNPYKPYQRSGINFNESTVSNLNQTLTSITKFVDKTAESSDQRLLERNGDLKINKSENVIKITGNKTESEITNNNLNLTSVEIREGLKNVALKSEDNTFDEKIVSPKTGSHLRSSNIKKSNEDKWINNNFGTKRAKEYEVFEVAREKPPFKLLNEVKMNQRSNYVPIYDYAYENAYFRPYDKFGPDFRNIELEDLQNNDLGRAKTLKEEDKDEFDVNTPNIRSRFSSYNNKGDSRFRVKNINYPINKGNSKMYGFMKPVPTRFVSNNKYYNPYDYFDIDYAKRNNGRYILRSAHVQKYKKFPDSNESDHPFNSIHKSDLIKDHVRAIRKVLYLQKMFGYVPEIDKEMRKYDQNAEMYRFPMKKTTENPIKEPIKYKVSMDYYYERANSREDSKDTQRARENSSQAKTFIVIPNKDIVGEFDAVLNRNNEKHSISVKSTEHLNKQNYQTKNTSKFSSYFDAILDVLADMIRFDNEDLEHYDWLRTSVNIQSALRKLLDLTENLKHGKRIHPKDLELLKYCLYLFKSSKVSIQKYGRENTMDVHDKRRKKKLILPKNRKKNRNKHPLLLWKDFAKYIRNDVVDEQKFKVLHDFEDFLQNILFNLNELHVALKHIATITKFDNQKWFHDLKEIYFKKATRKQLGNVLLHLSVFSLLQHLEDDAANVSKENFRSFVENNSEEVALARKDFVFVFRVLDELNRLNV